MTKVRPVRQIRAAICLLVLGCVALVGATVTQSVVYVTTQRFEHGLMVWRQDTGTIYVLDDQQRATIFTARAYSALPDNPVRATSGSLRPIFGFGKVWGNFADIRHRLGDPLLPEIGFETTLTADPPIISFTQLDHSLIQINLAGSWSNVPAPASTPCQYTMFFPFNNDGICPGQPTTSEAAYQPFEHGFMIWTRNNGDIWVFVDADPGKQYRPDWMHFGESSYAKFAPSQSAAPPGKVKPINGFGLVWANLTGQYSDPLKTELGWATAPETAYTTTVQMWARAMHVHEYLSLPDGRIVDAYSGLAGIYWWWAN